MLKTLTKHANKLALVIDKPLLELLHANADTPLEIITDGRSLVLTPVREEAEEKKFNDAIEMVHKRFGNAMRELAK